MHLLVFRSGQPETCNLKLNNSLPHHSINTGFAGTQQKYGDKPCKIKCGLFTDTKDVTIMSPEQGNSHTHNEREHGKAGEVSY